MQKILRHSSDVTLIVTTVGENSKNARYTSTLRLSFPQYTFLIFTEIFRQLRVNSSSHNPTNKTELTKLINETKSMKNILYLTRV